MVTINKMELKYCKSDEMIEDMLMKGISKRQFAKLRNMIGLRNISDCEWRGVLKIEHSSSIVNEAIWTVYLFIFFYKDILHKKTHELCLIVLIRLKSIIKHTSNFHLDIMPRRIKNNFLFKYFYALKKARKQLSFRYYV